MFKNFEEFENNKQWSKALKEIEGIIVEYPNNVEAYVRVIYFLHNILVEETCSNDFYNLSERLVLKYYDEGVMKFSENSEFLFFVGVITHIAEWYFGLNDGMQDMPNHISTQMQKKAYELDSKNQLFELMYRFSIEEQNQYTDLFDSVVSNRIYIDWLESKGFPGRYIIDVQLVIP